MASMSCGQTAINVAASSRRPIKLALVEPLRAAGLHPYKRLRPILRHFPQKTTSRRDLVHRGTRITIPDDGGPSGCRRQCFRTSCCLIGWVLFPDQSTSVPHHPNDVRCCCKTLGFTTHQQFSASAVSCRVRSTLLTRGLNAMQQQGIASRIARGSGTQLRELAHYPVRSCGRSPPPRTTLFCDIWYSSILRGLRVDYVGSTNHKILRPTVLDRVNYAEGLHGFDGVVAPVLQGESEA
jgi:hypothetical protein